MNQYLPRYKIPISKCHMHLNNIIGFATHFQYYFDLVLQPNSVSAAQYEP